MPLEILQRARDALRSNMAAACVLAAVVVCVVGLLVVLQSLSGPGAIVRAENAARSALAAEIEAERAEHLRQAIERARQAEQYAARERDRADEAEQIARAAAAALELRLGQHPLAQTVCFPPDVVEAINK